MALTIADAFKFAFINYEKGGKADMAQASSPVAKDDNKKSTQHGTPVVNSVKTDIHRNPTTTTLAPLDAPLIQFTADSSSSTEMHRMQALVMCLTDVNTILAVSHYRTYLYVSLFQWFSFFSWGGAQKTACGKKAKVFGR